MVVAVGGDDLVHRHRCVFVVGVGPNHQRSPPDWVDGVEHDRVVAHEGHHVVWELLRRLDVRREGSAGTLQKQKEKSVSDLWIIQQSTKMYLYNCSESSIRDSFYT